MLEGMEEMAISRFKAQCLALLERVRRTRVPLLVTRHGVPIAQVSPPPPPPRPDDWLGTMRDTGHIAGDLIAPVVPPSAWEVLDS